MDDSTNEPDASLEFENMDMENFYEKDSEDFEETKMRMERTFHSHTSEPFSESGLVDGILTKLYIYFCEKLSL